MVRQRIERVMKPRMVISDSGLLFVDSDGDRVFWLGFRAL
jgi:hypothetical protein